MKAIVGDICYPKSKVVVFPDDSLGSMQSVIHTHVSDLALSGVVKDSERVLAKERVEVGGCFETSPGRLRRRGVEKIYHVVIKRLQSDFTSVYIVQKGINSALRKAVQNSVEDITICGIGIDAGDLDPISVARIMVDVCKKYDRKLKIKIIDSNEIFINEIQRIIKGTVYENT